MLIISPVKSGAQLHKPPVVHTVRCHYRVSSNTSSLIKAFWLLESRCAEPKMIVAVTCSYVVVYSYFLYRNKQTSAKTRWAFEVITPPPQGGIYISKIKSNSRSKV